ncbi:MAG: 7-cyano-7-deazaguanine synthase QueC [Candidatus Methanomethylicia archaeon]
MVSRVLDSLNNILNKILYSKYTINNDEDQKLKSKVLVALSGGIDSTVLLYLCKEIFNEVYAISFDYGQKHSVELKYAKEIAKLASVKDHIIVEIPHYKLLNKSPLLAHGSEMPEGIVMIDNVPAANVPMRNLTFLSIMSSITDEYGINYLAIGVHATDNPFPDCRPEFITAMEAAINSASAYVQKTKERIHIFAPFLGVSKIDVVKLGKELDVPFEKTYSCYSGTEPPCGKCATCIQRKEALEAIGYY